MTTNHNFKELQIWKRSMELTKMIYQLTITFPDSERFGLTSQLRRSAISIPSNIAEGSGRGSDREFLRISLSSAFEVETQLILSKMLWNESIDLNLLANSLFEINEIQNMIYGFQKKINQ